MADALGIPKDSQFWLKKHLRMLRTASHDDVAPQQYNMH